MAKNKKEKKIIASQDPSSTSGKKRLDVSIQAIIGNIIFSKDEVWAYYELPTTIYDFLSASSKVSMAVQTERAFVALMRGKDEYLDMHVLVITTPIDIDRWEYDYEKLADMWDKRPGFEKLMRTQLGILSDGNFFEKRVLLGIKLGKRHELNMDYANPLQSGLKDAIKYLKEFANDLMSTKEYEISQDEIDQAQITEKDLYSIIKNGALHGERSTAEELALIVKRTVYPTMPVPYLSRDDSEYWGAGDIIRELGSVIYTKDPKTIRVDQVIDGTPMSGYRATLTFKKFQENFEIPVRMPWLYQAIFTTASAPFDISCRFSLIPNRAMKKKVSKTIADRKDALENAQGAGVSPSQSVIDDYYDAKALEGMLDKDDTPWLQGTFRIAIYAQDLDDLNDYVKQMQAIYNEKQKIDLVWTFHDQLDLLLEFMPGDHLREDSFVQTATVSMLTASGFNILNKVGD